MVALASCTQNCPTEQGVIRFTSCIHTDITARRDCATVVHIFKQICCRQAGGRLLQAGDAVGPRAAAPATPALAAVPVAAVSSAAAGGLKPLPATPGNDDSGADAEGDGYDGSSEHSTLASLAANCSHITAEAALRNATASFASAHTLPLRDAWCVNPCVPQTWLTDAFCRGQPPCWMRSAPVSLQECDQLSSSSSLRLISGPFASLNRACLYKGSDVNDHRTP